MAVSIPGGSIRAVSTIRHGGVANLLDLLATARPAWQADALCKEYPEVNFFPERGQPAAPAKAVCGRCAVAEECRAFSLATPEPAGVWGGLSRQERAELVEDRRWLEVCRAEPCQACGREGLRNSRRGYCGTCDRAWVRAGKPVNEEREAFEAAQRAKVAA